MLHTTLSSRRTWIALIHVRGFYTLACDGPNVPRLKRCSSRHGGMRAKTSQVAIICDD